MLAVGVIALAAAAAGGAYAATGTGTTTVRGCVTKSTRVLYLAPCHTGDKQISWNKVGPAGPGSPSVVGSLNPNCTQHDPSTSYTVTTNGTDGCQITIPGATFSRLPVLLVTPMGNMTVTGIGEIGTHSTSWELGYTLSGPSGVVNFAALQESP
jgi:hypothetical protein